MNISLLKSLHPHSCCWFLNTNVSGDEGEMQHFPETTDLSSERLKLQLSKLQIMFEVENKDFHVPRLCVKSRATATVHDWSKQVREHPGKVTLHLKDSGCIFQAFLSEGGILALPSKW